MWKPAEFCEGSKQNGEKAAWVNIPTAAELRRVRMGFKIADSVLSKMNVYHRLPKTSLEALAARTDALKAASDAVGQLLSENESDDTQINAYGYLRRTFDRKASYLKQLRILFDQKALVTDKEAVKAGIVYDEAVVGSYFTSFHSNNSTRCPILLNKDPILDVRDGALWGQYWLEMVDPAHRPLDMKKKAWEERMARTLTSPIPFFLWMEDEPFDKEHKKLSLFTPEDLEEKKAKIEDGKILVRGNEGNLVPLTTDDDKEAIFSFDEEDGLYITEVSRKDDTRHVSMSHGRAVPGVGSLKAQDGDLSFLGLNSGHYLPTREEGRQIVQVFQDSAVRMPDETPLLYFENMLGKNTTVGKFMRSRCP